MRLPDGAEARIIPEHVVRGCADVLVAYAHLLVGKVERLACCRASGIGEAISVLRANGVPLTGWDALLPEDDWAPAASSRVLIASPNL